MFIMFGAGFLAIWYRRTWHKKALIHWREPSWSKKARLKNDILTLLRATSKIRVSVLLLVILPALFYSIRAYFPPNSNWIAAYFITLAALPIGMVFLLLWFLALEYLGGGEVTIRSDAVFFHGFLSMNKILFTQNASITVDQSSRKEPFMTIKREKDEAVIGIAANVNLQQLKAIIQELSGGRANKT